jgi:predicted nucleic acid-binding protein
MIVAVDTNIAIYLVEHHPTWAPVARVALAAHLAAGATIALSDLARAECLVGPIRSGNTTLESAYRRFFAAVQMLPLTPATCERAAAIRVRSGMGVKLLDALHIAAAVEAGCSRFITNDAGLADCHDITVETL